MKKNLFFLKFLLLFNVINIAAQQDAQYTQYMYNTININPAYAGSRGTLSVFGLYRAQWVGLEGAPKTSAFSINTPINDSNLGIGVSLVNDKIGASDKSSLSTDFSYTVQTSDNFKLSFGLKGTVSLFNLDTNRLNPADLDDPHLQNLNNVISPNIGAGVYWHSDKAYIGLSAPDFIVTNYYDNNEVAIFKNKINYYLMGGYVFNLSAYNNIKFKPAVLTKITQGAPLQVDVSGNFMFNDKFMVGIAYRWDAAFSTMAGFQLTDGMYIGYGYDLESSKLNNYSNGSHEIFLRFEFIRKQSRMTTPRFF
ncbi:type IX secretion system membrane protein PorP/SprF [Flavobacterium sp. UGB4466]|uniref:PorP/SprF family type IX secretion system membrane protein n=1 Tax=Flavobacterium sp. UGB4466 TaxID=2730889 RepID=UPI00192B3481|nr:type IX secretion system membrane protein PorP/SprF [Flavobacterium sp. UGB4466]